MTISAHINLALVIRSKLIGLFEVWKDNIYISYQLVSIIVYTEELEGIDIISAKQDSSYNLNSITSFFHKRFSQYRESKTNFNKPIMAT